MKLSDDEQKIVDDYAVRRRLGSGVSLLNGVAGALMCIPLLMMIAGMKVSISAAAMGGQGLVLFGWSLVQEPRRVLASLLRKLGLPSSSTHGPAVLDLTGAETRVLKRLMVLGPRDVRRRAWTVVTCLAVAILSLPAGEGLAAALRAAHAAKPVVGIVRTSGGLITGAGIVLFVVSLARWQKAMLGRVLQRWAQQAGAADLG